MEDLSKDFMYESSSYSLYPLPSEKDFIKNILWFQGQRNKRAEKYRIGAERLDHLVGFFENSSQITLSKSHKSLRQNTANHSGETPQIT